MARIGPVHIQTLEGEPIAIGETTLIPQAQLITLGRRRGSVTKSGFGGWGWASALLIPKAIIEERGGSKRRIPIPDRTARALLSIALVALAVALLSILVGVLVQSLSTERGGD